MNEDEERELLRRLIQAGKFLDKRDRMDIEAYLMGATNPNRPYVQYINLDDERQLWDTLKTKTRLMPPPKEEAPEKFTKEDGEAAKAWGIKL